MNQRNPSSRQESNLCRRVHNMTAEQIQKKRAIDRDNQRHLRAKNKALVRRLEDQVAQLTTKLGNAEARIVMLEQQLSQSRATDSYDNFEVPPSDISLDQLPLDLGFGITLDLSDSAGAFSFQDIGAPHEFFDSSNVTSAWSSTEEKAEWYTVPLHLPPTTRLDKFISGTVEALREQASSSAQHYTEPSMSTFPSIASLINRPATTPEPQEGANRPLSSLVAANIFTSPLRPSIERLATMYHLSHFVRWLVCRTKESYDQMPTCLRPSVLQKTVPHPPWVDFVLFPEARDEIIRRRDWEDFEGFRRITSQTLSINWPFPDSSAVIESEDGRHFTLHPAFEAHIRDGENWSMGPEITSLYPYMAQFVRR